MAKAYVSDISLFLNCANKENKLILDKCDLIWTIKIKKYPILHIQHIKYLYIDIIKKIFPYYIYQISLKIYYCNTVTYKFNLKDSIMII